MWIQSKSNEGRWIRIKYNEIVDVNDTGTFVVLQMPVDASTVRTVMYDGLGW